MSTMCRWGPLSFTYTRCALPRVNFTGSLLTPKRAGPALVHQCEQQRDRRGQGKRATELPSVPQRRNPRTLPTASCALHKHKFRSFVPSWSVCQVPGHVAGDHVACNERSYCDHWSTRQGKVCRVQQKTGNLPHFYVLCVSYCADGVGAVPLKKTKKQSQSKEREILIYSSSRLQRF